MNIKRYFRKESIFRNVITLASGTVVAQLIALVVQPVLRRIVPVEDFGAFAVYMSVVGIAATVFTLRYDMAVVIPKEDSKASELTHGAILASLILSVFTFLLILLFGETLLNLLTVDLSYLHWFYYLPATLFFASAYRMLNNWLVRKKKFAIAASNKGIRRSVEAGGQTSLAFANFHGSLILGELFGSAINFFVASYQSFRTGLGWKNISLHSIWATLKEYQQFPKYNIFPVLLNNAAAWLPILFITRFFTIDITGQFDLTRQVFAITLSLISMAVAQVYLQRISDMRIRKQKIFPDIISVSKILGLISLFGILITLMFGPFLFGFVFGADYTISGVYAQIMIVSFSIKLIVSPLSVVFVNLEKLKLNAVWQILYFLGILSLLLFKFESIIGFLYVNVAIDVIAYLIYYLLILYISKQHDRHLDSLA
ncbi:MAG: lipopolysaccharide biosynthesis protein [Bacteroidales bacterium]|nr:lipopolysaccharide biosynthesis protein [Bacteroidales bacterium]